jgi:hypothetical protein
MVVLKDGMNKHIQFSIVRILSEEQSADGSGILGKILKPSDLSGQNSDKIPT